MSSEQTTQILSLAFQLEVAEDGLKMIQRYCNTFIKTCEDFEQKGTSVSSILSIVDQANRHLEEAKKRASEICGGCHGDGLNHPNPDVFEIVEDEPCEECQGEGRVM